MIDLISIFFLNNLVHTKFVYRKTVETISVPATKKCIPLATSRSPSEIIYDYEKKDK